MTAREFCYWLQGFMELRSAGLPQMAGTQLPVGSISSEQADAIQRHLNMVFVHDIDPSAGPQSHQKVLNHLHNGPVDNSAPCPRC